jgi:hypothetical protein
MISSIAEFTLGMAQVFFGSTGTLQFTISCPGSYSHPRDGSLKKDEVYFRLNLD